MRIAIVTEFCKPYYAGGGEIRYNEIYKRLVQKGHTVDLICYRFDNHITNEVIEGINIYHVGPVIKEPPKRTTLDFIHYIWACFWFLLHHDYDVIDSNTYIPLIPSFVISKLKKIPMMATINIIIEDWDEDEYDPKLASFIERTLFRLPYDKVLTVSSYAKQILIDNFSVKPELVRVVHNGVDIKLINSIKTKKKNENQIIFVGRLVWFKHVLDTVVATIILKKRFDDISLKVVGDGKYMGLLMGKARHRDYIKVLGKLSYENTIKQIKESDVLVLPSTKDTFGMVLVEAMACGVPVVAYDIAGPKEIINNGFNGFLAKPNDKKDLAEKIGWVLGNKKLKDAMGRKGMKYVEEMFSWNIIANNIEKELEVMV